MLTTQQVESILKDKISRSLAKRLRQYHPLPADTIQWLARLATLQGVPFNNLVADEKLLPNNAIRFFYIDQQWIDMLIDGAMSIGIHSGRDIWLQQAISVFIKQDVDKVVANTSNDVTIGTLSGLLIRSKLISDYSGIEIQGYKLDEEDNAQIPVKAIRQERLSPNVLLMIFETVPNVIEIKEPAEGRTLGFSELADNNKYLNLKDVEMDNATATPLLDAQNNIQQYKLSDVNYRNKEKRILNIKSLIRGINRALPNQTKKLTPKDLAIQLLQTQNTYSIENKDTSIPESITRHVMETDTSDEDLKDFLLSD